MPEVISPIICSEYFLWHLFPVW